MTKEQLIEKLNDIEWEDFEVKKHNQIFQKIPGKW